MATIPIRDVPGDPVQPSGDELILIDNGIAMQKATINDAVTPKATEIADDKIAALNLGTASQSNVEDFATAAQGLLADSAVQPTREIIAGTGLTGGGDLSADRTISLDASSIASLAKADTAVQSVVAGANVTVDATDPRNPIISASGGGGAASTDFATVADLLADDNDKIGYAGSGADTEVLPGDIITAQGFRYEVAASDATDYDRETAGGVRLKVPDNIPEAFVEMFGDDEDAYLRAMRTKKLFRCTGPSGTINEVTIYCDPVNGSDGNLGTIDAPLKTIQEAVDRLPKYYENILITIDLYTAHQSAVYYDEDVVIKGISGTAVGNTPRTDGIRIYGNLSDRSDVKVGSLVAAGCWGLIVLDARSLTLTREAPWPADENEMAAIQFINCDEIFIIDIGFDPEPGKNIRIGMIAYNSKVIARFWHGDNLDYTIIHAKRGSRVQAQNFFGTFNPVEDAWSSYVGGAPFAATENDSLVQYYIGNGDNLTLGPNSRGLWQCRGKNGGRVQVTSINDAYDVSSGAWNDFDAAVVAYQGQDEAVPRGAWQTIVFDQIVKDDRNRFQPTGRYYFVSSTLRGVFRLSAKISVRASDFSDGQALRARIVTEVGVVDQTLYEKGPVGNDPITLHVEALLVIGTDVTVGNYVAVQFLGAGSGNTLIYGGRDKTKFEMSRVG